MIHPELTANDREFWRLRELEELVIATMRDEEGPQHQCGKLLPESTEPVTEED